MIAPHKPLHPFHAAARPKTQLRGDIHLRIEGQAIIFSAGAQMQMASHRPKKPLGHGKAAQFPTAQNTVGDHAFKRSDAIGVTRNPKQRVQIAQPALAIFHVRFNHIALIADAFKAVFTLIKFAVEKRNSSAGDNIFIKALKQFFGQGLIPRQMTTFEHRGADGDVVFRGFQLLAEASRRVTHRQPQIPQHIKQGFNSRHGGFIRLDGG